MNEVLAQIWPLIAGWNGVVMLTYGIDKWLARKGGRRLSEATLLWMAALGAGPGALVGMLLFRHKTRKPAFRYGVPILLLLQAAPLWWAAGLLELWR